MINQIMISDLFLVKKFKETKDQKFIKSLYDKYLPVIYKYSKKVSYGGKNKEIKKDFEQDIYIELFNCINSINLNLINKDQEESWSIWRLFKYKLMNLSKSYFKTNSKYVLMESCEHDDIENFKKIKECSLLEKNKKLIKRHIFNNYFIFDFDSYIDVNDIIYMIRNSKNISSLERKIFEKRYNGESLTSIENSMEKGKPYWYLYCLGRKIKERFGLEYWRNSYKHTLRR